MLADIENAKLELQKYGNQLAYQKYQDALSNYMNFANYDYTKAMNDRDYNYQVSRDKVSDSQWQKEYDLALKQYELSKKKATSSGSSRSTSGSRKSNSSSSSKTFGDNTKTNTETTQNITLQDIIKGLQHVAGPGVSQKIYDKYSGKYFSSPDEVIKYWSKQ